MTEAILQVAAVSCVTMLVLYLVWLKTRMSAVVDVGWAFLVLGSVVFLSLKGDADVSRRTVVGLLTGAWALRLAMYLLIDRVVKAPKDDGRYIYMVEWAGPRAPLVMGIFYQMQAMFVVLFALPIAAACFSDAGALGTAAWIGVAIGVLSILGESLSDRQLARFRKDPANAGKTCQDGLWAWCRHPNYFFEWAFWFSLIGLSWGGSTLWLAATGPVIVYLFLMKITGIPHTERQAASHRAGYREYQQSTPMFFPRPPRRLSRIVERRQEGWAKE